MAYESPYGGRNDRALWMVQETQAPEWFRLRALKKGGEIEVSLRCDDIFIWACADAETLPDSEWLEFERTLQKARDDLGWEDEALTWFPAAWAVKLRRMAPQKPATDRYPNFVRMLDFLEVPWREMKRADQS